MPGGNVAGDSNLELVDSSRTGVGPLLRRQLAVWLDPPISQVHAAAIEVLIKQSRVSTFVHLGNGALFAVLLSAMGADLPLVWAWAAIVWAVALLRERLASPYRGRKLSSPEAERAARQVSLGALASGLLWGIAGFAFFGDGVYVQQTFVIVIVLGMASGAVGVLHPHLPAILAFVLPSCLALILRLLLEADSAHITLAIMGLFYGGALLTTAYCVNRVLMESLALRFEKDELVDHLTAARAKAESANRAKTAFLTVMTHELRTPLNAVMGFAKLLKDEAGSAASSERTRDYSAQIYESGGHLLAMIDDLLDVAQAESGRIELREERFDLADLIESAVKSLTPRADTAEVALRCESLGSLPMFWGDPRRLRQVLLNIVANAIKFTPAGGKVTVTARQEPDGGLAIEIADSGIGMGPEEIETAMQVFGQVDAGLSRRHEGAGIGLPLARSLVELHQGRLGIESQKGAGTRVYIHLPAERFAESHSDPASQSA